jgi:hypothetical protein
MSHAEGWQTRADGERSHSEGNNTQAQEDDSHAEGIYTIAQNVGMHAAGQYNVGTATDTIHETGIGTGLSNRLNAFEIYTDGAVLAPEATPSIVDGRGEQALVPISYLLSAEFGNRLPTADPLEAGKLWNDSGVMKISNG